jgi:hypothetical protein
MLVCPRESPVEARPYDPCTARQFCNAVLPDLDLNGTTNHGNVAGLECGVKAFRSRSAARLIRSDGSSLFGHFSKKIGRAVRPT